MKYILIDEQRRQNALDYIKAIDISKPIEVFIREYKKRRSISQNNLYWMWLPILGDHFGETKEEMHETIAAHFLGVTERITRHGHKIVKPISTTTLSTKEFTLYLEKIEALAHRENIKLLMPDDYRFAMMK